MMKFRILALALAVSLFGCSRSSSSSSSSNDVPDNDHWSIDKTSVEDQLVTISFSNVSGQSLNLIQPLEKKIEMRSGNDWVPVGVLYCDCENPCPAPPESQTIESGGTFTFTWDKVVEECVTEGNSSRTEKSDAVAGTYRINYSYQLTNVRGVLQLQAEFVIE